MPIRATSAVAHLELGRRRRPVTETTMPSAGLTSTPSRSGVTRHGSRKKYTIHRVTTEATQPAGRATQNSRAVANDRREDEFEAVRMQRRQNVSQHASTANARDAAGLTVPSRRQAASKTADVSSSAATAGNSGISLNPVDDVVAVGAQAHPAAPGGGASGDDAADVRDRAGADPEDAAAGRLRRPAPACRAWCGHRRTRSG